MAKTNIRSIRLSDEVTEIIERQIGENFTQKFEALVIRSMFELPETERRLEHLNQEIYEKRQQLSRLYQKTKALSAALQNMERDMQSLSRTINKAIEIEL